MASHHGAVEICGDLLPGFEEPSIFHEIP